MSRVSYGGRVLENGVGIFLGKGLYDEQVVYNHKQMANWVWGINNNVMSDRSSTRQVYYFRLLFLSI